MYPGVLAVSMRKYVYAVLLLARLRRVDAYDPKKRAFAEVTWLELMYPA